MIEKKVPKLRFPEFSGNWICKSLKNLSTQISYGLTVRPDYIESGVPLISARELKNGLIDYKNAPKISMESYEELSEKAKAKNGDIFLTKTGTIGLSAYVQESFNIAITQNIAVIRINDVRYNHQFILQTFKTDKFYKIAMSKVNQSTIMDLQLQDIRDLHIFLPLVQEQIKIADFMTSVDNKIQQLAKKKEFLEQYKKGVTQQIFSQQIRFKDDNGNDYPNWKSDKLGDVLLFIRNNSFSRNQLNLNSGIIQNIHYGDIHTKFRNHIDVASSVIPYINDDVSIESIQNHEYCQNGDLIIADASEDYKDVGKAVEIKNIGTKKILSGLHTILARNKISFALGFKAYLMQSTYVRSQIEKIANGISVLGISKTNLANISFDYPCLEEQTKIANFIASIDDKITQVNNNLEQTKLFKKSLLQQLFI